MNALGVVVCQVDAEGGAAGRRRRNQSNVDGIRLARDGRAPLPVGMSNQDICPACVFHEDEGDLPAQGVEGVGGSGLGC